MKKVKFIKSPGAFDLAYFEGDIAEFDDKQALMLIRKGFATDKLEEEDESELPGDLPAREVFVKLGVTMEELKEVKDFTVYEGIGNAIAKKLDEYFNPVDPEAEAKAAEAEAKAKEEEEAKAKAEAEAKAKDKGKK